MEHGPSSGPAQGPADAVEALRDALRRGAVDEVQRHRWLAPRPPGERDLLSDMAAAEGLSTAVKKLSRFWRDVEIQLEHVRVVDDHEAEVYERLTLPLGSLPILSLVRRQSGVHPWQVVCTNEARDERFVLWVTLPSDVEQIDDARWVRAAEDRHGLRGELLMDDGGGVLGHPDRGWLVSVNGPFVPLQWPEALPGEGGRVLELSLGLSSAAEERREQLAWMMLAGLAFLEELGGDAAYMPGAQQLVLRAALSAVARGAARPEQALRFWARVDEIGGHVVTSGLGRLGLPEVEAAADLLATPARTAHLVRWMGAALLQPNTPTVGTELLVGERSALVVPGRRGPRRGATYGRFGAIRLVAADANVGGRGSRTRMRVPLRTDR